jgi:hypothetical protein
MCLHAAGFVRFASEQYSSSKSSLKHATMHLTNYSINKNAPNFKQPGSSNSSTTSSCKQEQQKQKQDTQTADDAADSDSDSGCDGEHSSDGSASSCRDRSGAAAANKWSFQQLAEHLQQQGH